MIQIYFAQRFKITVKNLGKQPKLFYYFNNIFMRIINIYHSRYGEIVCITILRMKF